MINQPAHLVAEEIEGLFRDRLRDDLLLLYVSCHGVKDDTGRLYFATTNTKVHRLAATGVPSAFVSERMDHSRSRKIVLLLDCCYSRAFARGLHPRAGEMTPPPSRTRSHFTAPPRSARQRHRCGRGKTDLTSSSRPVRQ